MAKSAVSTSSMAKSAENNFLDVIRYQAEAMFRRIIGWYDVARRMDEPDGFTDDFARIGEELRILVEEIEKTPQGRRAKKLANEVRLRALTGESLRKIGFQIFTNGITENSLAIFYIFCKELMKRCWEAAVELGRNIYVWTTDFIFDTICPWVADNGGWGKVLGMMAGALGLTALVGVFLILI